jgi:hypothetical protein
VFSAILLVLAIPLVSSVVNQIRMILPLGSDARSNQAMREHARPIAQDGPTTAVRSALSDMHRGKLTTGGLNACRRVDPDNGLYDYLEAALAAGPTEGETHALIPRGRLLALRRAAPVDLHRARLRRITLARLEKNRLDPRMMEVMFLLRYQWIARLPPEGPVLRDITATFLNDAREYRHAGRDEEAALLEDSVARLALDLVDHEPGPAEALLAADILAAWADHLGATGQKEGQPPRVEQVMNEARSLRTRWHQTATGEEVNLLPYTYSAVCVPQAHQRVMSSLAAGVVSITACLVLVVALATIALSLRIVASMSNEWEPVPGWRKRAWLAALVAVAPILVAVIVLLVVNVGWTWVISSPTLRSVWMLPFVFAVWLLLVAWSFMTPPLLPRASRWRHLLWTPAVLLAVLVLLDLSLRPMGSDPWLAPISIRRFRILSIDLGIAAVPVLIACVALLYGARRSAARLRSGRRDSAAHDPQKRHPGVPAVSTVAVRAAWAVAVRALLIMASVTLILLIWNRVQDLAHRRQFVAAMEDPMASRLGPDWRERHFGTARSVWEDRPAGR